MRVPTRAPGRLVRAAGPLLLAAGLVLTAQPAPARAAEPNFPAKDSRYHNWPELVAEIQRAQQNYPSIVKLFSIGKSYQGRTIWAAKISDNVNEDENEPEILIDALHHAREHLTTEQALAILRWMTTGYGNDQLVTRLVDTRETFVIFALNPDGMRFDLTGSPYRAWRKNRQLNSSGAPIFTDLNRNYGYKFGCCGGSSGNRSSITYRGPAAFSAPETRAMRAFVASRVVGGVQQIRAHITLHTNGQLILWPYGYTKANLPPDMTATDRATFVALGKAMAARNGYRAMQSSDLYITDGDQIDWLYHQYRIFSFTFELYPPETPTVWGDHYPPDERIAAQTARNRSAILYLIDQAGCPYAALSASSAQINCGPLYDDFEVSRGWSLDPYGTDTATGGAWQRGIPQATSASGPKQLATVDSGQADLVTGAAAGGTVTSNDLDGTTTIRSRPIRLPDDPANVGDLVFRYTFAHGVSATADDALRVKIQAEDDSLTTVFEVTGSGADRDAAWATGRASLDAFAGQTIRVVFEAVDGADDSLVEAAVDTVRILRS